MRRHAGRPSKQTVQLPIALSADNLNIQETSANVPADAPNVTNNTSFGRSPADHRAARTSTVQASPSGVGYMRAAPTSNNHVVWYVKRMRWTLVNQRWIGVWFWAICDKSSFWSTETWMDEAALEHAIATGAGGHFPQEILAHIAVCARDEPLVLTGSICMVCRAWRSRCFPTLVSNLAVHPADLPSFVRFMQEPAALANMKPHLESLTVRDNVSAIPWLIVHTLGRIFGSTLRKLVLNIGTLAIHPSSSARIVLLRSCFTELRSLELRSGSFDSSTVLLRLLACLPRLESTCLAQVTCERYAPLVVPRRCPGLPMRVSATHMQSTQPLSMLALCWTWPLASRDDLPAYFGLPYTEGQIAASIISCFEQETLEFRLTPAVSSGRCMYSLPLRA